MNGIAGLLLLLFFIHFSHCDVELDVFLIVLVRIETVMIDEVGDETDEDRREGKKEVESELGLIDREGLGHYWFQLYSYDLRIIF